MVDDYFTELMPLLMVREADIRQLFGPALATQGETLFRQKLVNNRQITETGITATVGGYRPKIDNASEGGLYTSCNCAYPGDFCPHLPALLYAWVREPRTFEANIDRSSPEEEVEAGPTWSAEESASSPVLPASVAMTSASASLPGAPRSPEELREMTSQLLEEQKLAELRGIAKRHGWPLKGTAKEPIAEELSTRLQELVERPDYLKGLTDDERALLELAYTAYGLSIIPSQQALTSLWNRWRGPSQSGKFTAALNGLVQASLLLPCTKGEGSPAGNLHYHWLSFLTPALVPIIPPPRQLYPPGRISRLQRPNPVPGILTAMTLLVQYGRAAGVGLRSRPSEWLRLSTSPLFRGWEFLPGEARTVLSRGPYSYPLIESVTVPPATGILADDTRTQLAQWIGANVEVVDWWAQLAACLGLIALPEGNQGALSASIDAEIWERMNTMTPAQEQVLLWQAWRNFVSPLADLHAVLGHMETPTKEGPIAGAKISIQRSTTPGGLTPGTLAVDWMQGREFAIRLLAGLQTGLWYDWSTLAEFARRIRPDFLHSATQLSQWWLTTPDGRKRMDSNDRKDWERSYRPILAAWITGPLRWFGIVDVVLDGRELAAVQVTPLGAWLLRGEGSPPVEAGQVGKGPGATWLSEDSWQVRAGPAGAELFALSTLLGQPAGRPLAYRLTEHGVEQAFTAGYTPETIAARFAQAAAPLPPPLAAKIEGLWERFGRVHVYTDLTVIELADDLALREIQAATDLNQYIVHQFSPRLLAIRSQAVDPLVEQLVKKGYMPRVK